MCVDGVEECMQCTCLLPSALLCLHSYMYTKIFVLQSYYVAVFCSICRLLHIDICITIYTMCDCVDMHRASGELECNTDSHHQQRHTIHHVINRIRPQDVMWSLYLDYNHWPIQPSTDSNSMYWKWKVKYKVQWGPIVMSALKVSTNFSKEHTATKNTFIYPTTQLQQHFNWIIKNFNHLLSWSTNHPRSSTNHPPPPKTIDIVFFAL